MEYKDLPRRTIITSPFNEKPITSYGIAVIARDTKRCLLVQSNYSIGISYLFHGFYKPVHFDKIKSYITKSEIKILKDIVSSNNIEIFNEQYKKIYNKYPSSTYSYDRLIDIKDDIIEIDSNTLLDNVLFGVPKGRNMYREKSDDTATREFNEETGFTINNLSKYPYKYVTPGIAGNNYELNCWIHVIDKEFDLNEEEVKDKNEICNRIWSKIPYTGDSFIEGEFHIGKTDVGDINIDNETVAFINKYYYSLLE